MDDFSLAFTTCNDYADEINCKACVSAFCIHLKLFNIKALIEYGEALWPC